MVSNEAKDRYEKLKVYLIENFDAKPASGGRELIKRCHFCGDSKDRKSRHLYIGLHESGYIMYNCFKCGASGVVDGKFLRSLECTDVDIIQDINKYNKFMEKNAIVKKYDSKIFKVNNFYIRDCELTNQKINYINTRLGLSLNCENLKQLKIVPNLYDLLSSNNLEVFRRKEIADQINTYFIGVLSMNNSYLVLKNLAPGKVDKSIDKKYIDYNIFNSDSNKCKYYTIPTSINIYETIHLYIAEGFFDILSLYFNVVENKYNSVFTSIGGKAYLNFIKYFICSTGYINIVVHLCIDSDIEEYQLRFIKDFLQPLNIPLYIHINTKDGEKDFGVHKDRIIESIYKL